ncbi:MAG: hypothetical protein O7H41_21810, partial [Planctomycetota bacterium]|nr:hypothetical protein [Planctomycetota bacterium]
SAGVIVTFSADYLLRLPKGMRALALLTLLGVTAAAAARVLWMPLRRKPTTDELALRMEASFPELKDSVISALQLSRQVESEGFYQSRDLAQVVISQGEEAVGRIDLGRAAPGKRSHRVFGAALLSMGCVALLAAWSPYHASTWFKRIFLLSSVEWHKSVILRVVGISPDGETIVRGDDFHVRVMVEKGDPEEVVIHSRAESRSRWEVRPMVGYRREGEEGESYQRQFREVPEDFRFFVTGGDARTEEYVVKVMVPPSIQEISLRVTYPAYLDKEVDTIPDGNLRVPFGSSVEYQADASRTLEKAALVLGDAPGIPLTPVDGPRGQRARLTGSFDVEWRERTVRYHFSLTDEDGYSNARPIEFRLEVVPDRPPAVKVLVPGRNIRVSPRAVIPLQAEVVDDHGIRSVALVFHVTSGYEGEGEEEQIALPGPTGPSKKMTPTYSFDLSPLSVQLGDQIVYRFDADDFLELGQANRGSSPSYTLLVVSPEDIEADLDARLQKVRDDLRRTIRSQRATGDATLAITRVEGDWSDSYRPSLVQAELDQKKVSQGIARSIRHLDGIASDMKWNRVGEEKDLDWLEGLTQMLEEEAITRSNVVVDLLIRARKEKDIGLLGPAPGTQEEVVAVLEKAWRSLDKWTDFREVVRRIREIKDDEERIRERIRKLAPTGTPR